MSSLYFSSTNQEYVFYNFFVLEVDENDVSTYNRVHYTPPNIIELYRIGIQSVQMDGEVVHAHKLIVSF